MNTNRPALPPAAVAVAVAAGFASLFATYWDDSWHTDIGRDDALIPPHLLLYGAVAVVGLIVAGWGLAALWRTRSLAAVLRDRPLRTAGIGGAVTLAAAPLDAVWHSAFGRDAVLWSPPHMLAVFGTLALLSGILAGTGDVPWIWPFAGALLLGAALTPVIEYETDVPQFSETLYLPVLLVCALYAAILLRGLAPGRRFLVTAAVVVYVILRLAIMGGLAALGRSVPDLPVAIVGLAAVDLPWRRAGERPVIAYAMGAAGLAATSTIAAATGIGSARLGAVLPVAALVLLVVAVIVGRGTRRVVAAAAVFGALALPLATPERAWAHDPGQGTPVGRATVTVTSDGRGTLTLDADLRRGCAGFTPVQLAARRAGETVTAPLTSSGCRYAGRLHVDAPGRWFVYLRLRYGGELAETWLPVDASTAEHATRDRDVYLPAGRSDNASMPIGEVVSGALIYLVGLILLAAAFSLITVRRSPVGGSGEPGRRSNQGSPLRPLDQPAGPGPQ